MLNTPLTFVIGLALAAGLVGGGGYSRKRQPEAGQGAALELQDEGLPASFREKLRKHHITQNKLNSPVVLEKGLDKMTFGDAKQYFEDRFDLMILVNPGAFETTPAEELNVKLDKMSGVPLRTVLQMLVDQFNGAYRVHEGLVEITSREGVQPETWLSGDRSQVPLVHADFKEVSLNMAIRELAFETGITIVLDQSVYQELDEPDVTALLDGVCLDTAVELLASMCNMKSVALDRSLYVTSEIKGLKLETQREARRMAREKAEEKKAKEQEKAAAKKEPKHPGP